jgi:hypothetical protein
VESELKGRLSSVLISEHSLGDVNRTYLNDLPVQF